MKIKSLLDTKHSIGNSGVILALKATGADAFDVLKYFQPICSEDIPSVRCDIPQALTGGEFSRGTARLVSLAFPKIAILPVLLA